MSCHKYINEKETKRIILKKGDRVNDILTLYIKYTIDIPNVSCSPIIFDSKPL